jgi:hypothetical protein
MIYEWKAPDGQRNFGDAIYDFIYSKEFIEYCARSSDYLFFLVGSVICDETFDFAKSMQKVPVYIGCGWNGEKVSPEKMSQALFFGFRGEITKKLLKKDSSKSEVTGDPIYSLKVERLKKQSSGKKYFTPHITELNLLEHYSVYNCTDRCSPVVDSSNSIPSIIEKIRSAEFVLTGSMHFAMLAHLFQVPFAIFMDDKSKFVDHPPKWADWLSKFGIDKSEVVFVNTVTSGLAWYSTVENRLMFAANYSNYYDKNFEIKVIEKVSRNSLEMKYMNLNYSYSQLAQEMSNIKNSNSWKLSVILQKMFSFGGRVKLPRPSPPLT